MCALQGLGMYLLAMLDAATARALDPECVDSYVITARLLVVSQTHLHTTLAVSLLSHRTCNRLRLVASSLPALSSLSALWFELSL